MANVSQVVNFDILEKLADGTYKKKHPETKATQTLIESSNFVSVNVEDAMNELFTNVSNGKNLVGGAITDVDNSVTIPTDPTFQNLANAIGQIKTAELAGITWTQRTSSFGTDGISGVAYGQGMFVAVGSYGKLTTSINGTSWTQRNSSFGTDGINGVAYGQGMFVAVGSYGKLATSINSY